jgi:DNA-directed RNA polymerase subunit F
MNIFGWILVSILLLASGFLFAQTDDVARMSAEAVMAKQRHTVSSNMQLSKEEGKAFWPVYDAYAKSRGEIYNRLLTLVNTYAEQYANLSDSQAKDLVQEYVAIEAEVVTLHSEYLNQFAQVLPETKVLRFYQIDFKAMAETVSDIASIVPLAK